MTTLADIRAEYPELDGLDDGQAIDVIQQEFYPELPRETIAKRLGYEPPKPPAEPSSGMRRFVGDTGVSLLRGAIAVPEAVVGAADLVTGGRAGRMAEQAGFRPKEAKAFLADYYSPEQKAAFQEVQQAEGIVDTAGAVVRNPSVIAQTVAESLPSMGAGGVVARGARMLAPGMSPLVAGAAGEGAVSAGLGAEQIRQETADGLLSGEQSAIAAGSGAATGLLGLFGAKVAKSLGIADVDTMLAGAAKSDTARKSVVRKAVEGFVAEGLLEELPQSVQEQVAQNAALGKPLDEGVDQAAVLGVLSGGLMGGGAQLLPDRGPLSRAANAGIQSGAIPTGLPGVEPQTLGAPLEMDEQPWTPPAGTGPGLASAPPADGLPFEADPTFEQAPVHANGAAPAARQFGTQQAADIAIGEQGLMGSYAAVETAPGVFEIRPKDAPSIAMVAPGVYEAPAAADVAPTRVERPVPAPVETAPPATAIDEPAQAAPAPAPASPATLGDYPDEQSAREYISRQRRAASANLPPALPLEREDGSFSIATEGSPGWEAAQAQEVPRKRAAAGIKPDDVTRADGEPFLNKGAAVRAAKKLAGSNPVEVKGGWVVRPAPVIDAALSNGAPVAGEAIDEQWTAFAPESGTKGVPRAEMPQIKAEHRGAMVNFLNARGISHDTDVEIPAADLKPTQAEFSPSKVGKAQAFEGGDRSILVSSDGYVLDGHHQWLAKLDAGLPVKVIRLDAPIDTLMETVREFPSATASEGATTPAEIPPFRLDGDVAKALQGLGMRPAAAKKDQHWFMPMEEGLGLGDVYVDFDADGVATVTAEYLGKTMDTRKASGAAAIAAAVERARDGIQAGRRRMAAEQVAKERGVETPSTPAALPAPKDDDTNQPRAAEPEAQAAAEEAPAPAGGDGEAGSADAAPAGSADVQAAGVADPDSGVKDDAPAPAAATDPDAKDMPPRKRNAPAERARAARLAKLTDYFAPGNVVKGYAGHDRVLAFEPNSERGGWSVQVQHVIQKGGQWITDPRDSRERWHSTEPTAKELAAGPVQRAPTKDSGDENPVSESRQEKPEASEANDSRETVAPDKPAKAKIEDFGEKLEGARKDYAATLKEAMDVDVAAEPLSKSWPEPDYAKLLAGGADPKVVAVVRAARDEVRTKPQSSWKLSGWVEQVTRLREAADAALSGRATPAAALPPAPGVTPSVFNRTIEDGLRIAGRAALYEEVGHEKSLKGISFAEHHYSLYRGESNVRKWVVEQAAKATAFSNWPREIAVGNTREEALEAFKAKLGTLDLGRDAKKQPQFVIYGKRGQAGAWIGKKIGREYVDLKKLEDVAQARTYMADNLAALEALLSKYRETPMERRAENQPRVGDDHRNGAPVTPEIFADTFGFRGVQFGNYVEGDRRQSDLNESFDALMDLAAVLGVPPRALSLNGRLGLAFGARGKGGKNAPAAHYEPGTVVINLTKGGGPGALAHEWWHAADNYFARDFGAGGFATDGVRLDGLRDAMQVRFKDVRSATQAPTLRRRAAVLDKRRSKPYWNTPIELSARAFESYVIAKLKDQGAANDYLANIVDEQVWNISEAARAEFFGGEKVESYPYPGQAELPIVRAAFDEFFRTVEARADEGGNVALFEPRDDDYTADDGQQQDDDNSRRSVEPATGASLRSAQTGAGVPSGRRVRALGVGRDLQTAGVAALVGRIVSSPADLAEAAQVYRNPRYESFRIIFTKGESVVHATGVSMRLPGVTAAFPLGMDKRQGLQWIADQKAVSSADGYYLLHNHPSGDPTPSEEDLALTRDIAARVAGMRGHVIINSGKFAVVDETGASSVHALKRAGPDALLTPSVPSGFLGQSISTGQKVASIGKGLQSQSDAVVLIAHSPSRGINGIFEVNAARMKNALPARALIRRYGRMAGAIEMFAYGPRAAFADGRAANLVRDGFLKDVVYIDGGASESQVTGRSMNMVYGKDTTQGGNLLREKAGAPKAGESTNEVPSPAVAAMTSEGINARVDRAIKRVTTTNVKQLSANKATDWMGLGLQLLGRRQIVDIYGDMLPLTKYSELVAQMEADKNEAGAGADEIATAWGNLDDESALAELMHDATLAQIDPAKEHVEGDAKARWGDLRRRYLALSSDARGIYARARDAYADHHAAVHRALRDRIDRSDMKGPRKATLLRQMDQEFFKSIKGVYFPLARFGQYVVVTKDEQGKVANVSRAETMNEAAALRIQLLSDFPAAQGYQVGKVLRSKDFVAGRDSVGRGFMQDLYELIDRQNWDSAQRAEIEDALGQLYLSSMPDVSWAKHALHRKGTPGFSQDARRAFAQNVFHGARYLAKLRYGDLLHDELNLMQKAVDAKMEDPGFDSVRAQQVVDEMNKRHTALMSPAMNPLSTALTSLGFVFHLGLSPASAIVNLSQTALVAYPVMGAKWGYKQAATALLVASRDAASGRNNIRGRLNEEERRAFDEAVLAGVIDVTMAHDLAGIAQGEDARVSWKLRPVMKWASFLFHHAEKFNRQVTFVAAYRLAREAGANHAQAHADAVEATYDGHFDYSASNRPRVMQGNVARVLLLFKQYGQNMVYTLARQAQQAIKAEAPADRMQARRALGGLLTMHAMAAGALGLPMVTTLLAAASMVGGDDDDPWDAQTALQNMLADAFGQKPAEVLAHGFSRLTPWDISSRVGLDKLILPDVQEGLEGQRMAESAMTAALGPVAGIGVGALKGIDTISRGHWKQGLEEMMPAAVRGPLKALRYGSEGVVDKTGIVVKDDVDAAALVGQALGFSPSDVRLTNEGKSAILERDQALNARRQALTGQFAMAVIAGDHEGRQEARKAIAAFNSKHPIRHIGQDDLVRSVRSRRKRIDQAEGGVYLPASHRDVAEAGRFAVTE